MRILLSNDDGYLAPGIQALRALLQHDHDVTVVAPDRDRSGASNSLTLDRPLSARQVDANVFSVNGTPTDCVHLAITGLLEQEPDIVVSGINSGPNLGDDVLYSGTVAAAMEGRFLGLPAIAVSSTSFMPEHLDTAASLTLKLIYQLEEDPLPGNMILNLNIPDLPSDSLRGLAVTRLGSRHKAEPVVKSEDPRSRPIYWVGPPGPTQDAGDGTDFYAIQNNQASITPLHVDLTHHEIREQISSWLKHHDN
ncbi:MAG: 5'/3'-nucleotidase SurE [Gammaproteobacteria bacterium]|nr:MAG: 5'/3'-nucleotidase SurE [Gammaproteobacteria bacterium]